MVIQILLLGTFSTSPIVHIVPPPLKSLKSNIFGQSKLEEAKTNYKKRFGINNVQKYAEIFLFGQNILSKHGRKF